jgi:hypothetical protein
MLPRARVQPRPIEAKTATEQKSLARYAGGRPPALVGLVREANRVVPGASIRI